MERENVVDIERLRELSNEIDISFDLGDIKKGSDLLEKALTMSKEIDDAYYLFFKGEWEGYINKDDEAQVALYENAVKVKPDDYFLLRNLGVGYTIKNKFELADKCFEDAIKIKEDDYITWREKGSSEYKNSKYESSILSLDKALSINSDDYIAWRRLARTHYAVGEYEKSKKILDRCLNMNPADYTAWYNKGVILSHVENDDDGAINCFKKAVSLNKEDYNSYRQMGVSLSRMGNHEKAREMYEKALLINGNDKKTWLNKAINVYNESNNIDKAFEYANKAYEIDNEFDQTKRFLSFLHKRTKEKEEGSDDSGKLKSKQLASETQGIVARVRTSMESDFQGFLEQMSQAQNKLDAFIYEEKKGRSDGAWFHVLRKWNSYTPIIPADGPDRSVGGGYFFQSFGSGIVVDPGIGFIDNFYLAGFRVSDIDSIIITHAHNDHNSDLESILTLFYKHNEQVDGARPVDLYLNIGSFQKFSGLLNLRSSNHIGTVHVLMPGHEYIINDKTTFCALTAYHDEVVTKNYSVGLWFTVNDGEERNIIISSDTSLYPPDPYNKEKVVVDHDKEIGKTYNIGERKIHLLIPHLGSIKEQEFTKEYKDADTMFYRNHLGILGISVLINSINPELAVISEFGEELRSIQTQLIKLIEQVISESAENVKVLPGDVGLLYDVLTGDICCQINNEMTNFKSITTGCSTNGQFRYYNKDKLQDPAQFTASIEEWEEERKNGHLIYHINSH